VNGKYQLFWVIPAAGKVLPVGRFAEYSWRPRAGAVPTCGNNVALVISADARACWKFAMDACNVWLAAISWSSSEFNSSSRYNVHHDVFGIASLGSASRHGCDTSHFVATGALGRL
jgi:hypothetical protein